MDVFFRCTAAALVTVVLTMTIRPHSQQIALVLAMVACCMIAWSAVKLLSPVVRFLQQVKLSAQLDDTFVSMLLKIVGIGLLGEICASVCTDSGNSAIARCMQLLAVSVILYLSLPLFSSLLELIERILGEL